MGEEDGDYEDREGENFAVETDDPYITEHEYNCEKCGKTIKESGTDFAPFHCGRPMKLVHRLEHKFDFESITKRAIEKEQRLFPGSGLKTTRLGGGKKQKTNAKTKPAKKTKPRKAAKPAKKKQSLQPKKKRK